MDKNYAIFARGACCCLIFFLLILSVPFNAIAQNIPPGQEPEASANRFQGEAERRKTALQSKSVQPPQVELEEPAASAPRVSDVSFVLKDVRITGSTIFKPQDLRALYQGYIGKEVTFKDMNDIAGRIKSKYKEKGFLTTNVYIPEQEIAGGVIEIRAAEGRMGKLLIEGNKWFTKNILEKYFNSKKNEILNINTVQRDILRLNQNPDLEVKAVISPGEEPQTSDLALKVKDKFPYHVGGGSDNLGMRLTGKYRASVTGRSTNLTSNNDSFFYTSVVTADSSGDFVSYMAPIDTRGAKAGLDFSYFTVKIGREFRDFDIIGNTYNYIAHMTGEIYLTENMQISADSGINIKSISKSVHSDTTVEEQLRMPYYGMDISRIDSFLGGGQTMFSPKVDFGTGGFLGASREDHSKASRAGTGGYFFRYTHSLRRVQRMPWESYIILRHQFQGVSHTMPSSEQFQIGGESSVRGYPEGDYVSDIGANLNLDWIFPLYLIPKSYKLPFDDMPLRNEIQPVIFMDLGGGVLKRTLPGERESKFLMGVGGGLRINFYRKFNARIEWAEAIGAKPTENSGPSTFHLVVNFEI
ncbi:MAG: ShlB/FhaC/HecB family hemolysin secretion/activation protein [Candidatus Omnitrophota bacterium]|nr:ShlB/FhaC/HecB family hemolysin secretion/activation protein [Candidatus Omnitrophota bacterium]